AEHRRGLDRAPLELARLGDRSLRGVVDRYLARELRGLGVVAAETNDEAHPFAALLLLGQPPGERQRLLEERARVLRVAPGGDVGGGEALLDRAPELAPLLPVHRELRQHAGRARREAALELLGGAPV